MLYTSINSSTPILQLPVQGDCDLAHSQAHIGRALKFLRIWLRQIARLGSYNLANFELLSKQSGSLQANGLRLRIEMLSTIKFKMAVSCKKEKPPPAIPGAVYQLSQKACSLTEASDTSLLLLLSCLLLCNFLSSSLLWCSFLWSSLLCRLLSYLLLGSSFFLRHVFLLR